MKTIQLTKGQKTLVDDEDFEYLNQWKWRALWSINTKSYYAVAWNGKTSSGKKIGIRMNRLIMDTPKGLLCDHINHNTLDNRKENLRNVTRSQNQMNRKVHSNNKLQEKCIRKSGKKFRVSIMVNKIYVFSKTYPTLEEAITARNFQLSQYHGEFLSL